MPRKNSLQDSLKTSILIFDFLISNRLLSNYHLLLLKTTESTLITDPQTTDPAYLKNTESEHSLSNLINEIGLFCNPRFWLGADILRWLYGTTCTFWIYWICPLRVGNPYHCGIFFLKIEINLEKKLYFLQLLYFSAILHKDRVCKLCWFQPLETTYSKWPCLFKILVGLC